jgi:hypothetical protein
MKRLLFWQFILCGFILGGQAAQAGEVSLADWCVNVNGSVDASSVTDNPSNACNGGTNAPLASVNTAAFDMTLEPASNTLGSVTVSLNPGLNQFVAFYADYDVDFASFGSADDSGATQGSLPAGWSYELDDPNVSNLFSDFAAGALGNFNNVGTPSGPPNECCDVAWALGIGNLNVLAGGSGSVVFKIATSAPVSGFYLQQTDTDTANSIFLSATVNIQNPVTGAVPEPATLIPAGLALALFGGLILARRKRIAS